MVGVQSDLMLDSPERQAAMEGISDDYERQLNVLREVGSPFSARLYHSRVVSLQLYYCAIQPLLIARLLHSKQLLFYSTCEGLWQQQFDICLKLLCLLDKCSMRAVLALKYTCQAMICCAA